MNWFENNSLPPSQQDIFDATIQHAEQQFNCCIQNVQYKLSSGMEKAMNIAGDAIVAGAEFMSDYGGVIAVACYASGNVGLGLIVDGITFACDISLSTKKLYEGDISKLEFGVEVANSIVITAVGNKVGGNFAKAAERALLDKKTTEILSNIVADFVSQGIVTLEAVQLQ